MLARKLTCAASAGVVLLPHSLLFFCCRVRPMPVGWPCMRITASTHHHPSSVWLCLNSCSIRVYIFLCSCASAHICSAHVVLLSFSILHIVDWELFFPKEQYFDWMNLLEQNFVCWPSVGPQDIEHKHSNMHTHILMCFWSCALFICTFVSDLVFGLAEGMFDDPSLPCLACACYSTWHVTDVHEGTAVPCKLLNVQHSVAKL